jgi:hypothetical protein
MLKEALFAAALTFRPWHGDVEEPQDRKERLALIAEAISDAVDVATCAKAPLGLQPSEEKQPPCERLWSGDPRQLGFLLLAQAYFETRLARHVHEGNCRAQSGECDSGRAISLWQLQFGPHLAREEWQTLGAATLEATRRAAVHAARSLGRGFNYCRSLRGAISLYATGQTCSWRPATKREAFVRHLMAIH